MKWDGEWHITYEVFRDLGFAFAVVLIMIYTLVVGWFRSFSTPLVIMIAIPFSLVGILPAHWALDAFFTATSMDRLHGWGRDRGAQLHHPGGLHQAVGQAGHAPGAGGGGRWRCALPPHDADRLGGSVILFDPIVQGLAISLMAVEVASLLLSRMAVPIVYFHSMHRRARARLRGAA
jgi:hypothetical protein